MSNRNERRNLERENTKKRKQKGPDSVGHITQADYAWADKFLRKVIQKYTGITADPCFTNPNSRTKQMVHPDQYIRTLHYILNIYQYCQLPSDTTIEEIKKLPGKRKALAFLSDTQYQNVYKQKLNHNLINIQLLQEISDELFLTFDEDYIMGEINQIVE